MNTPAQLAYLAGLDALTAARRATPDGELSDAQEEEWANRLDTLFWAMSTDEQDAFETLWKAHREAQA